jgi:hypothetical protein
MKFEEFCERNNTNKSLVPARHHSRNGTTIEPAVLRNLLVVILCSLCVLATSPVGAKPAKNRSAVVPIEKQEPVRTDLTPRNRDECLAVAQTLNDQSKKLSEQTKQGVPREFARVASNLDRSCGVGDFNKGWISIEWINGCLNNFTKDFELGYCSRNEGYSCALNSRSDACTQRR